MNSGDICIDIGANIGEYALLMGRIVNPSGKVIAFEPQPNFHKLIQESVCLNQFESTVSADNRAVYNTSGEKLRFYISQNPNNTGTSSLVNHCVFINENKFIEIQTVTLNEICKEHSIHHINLIKVDVERAELEVLQGMTDLLKSQAIDYILLEQNASSESQTFLCSLGYTCWLIDEENRLLINSKNLQGLPYFGSFIFVNSSCIAGFMKEFANNLSA